MKRNSIAAGGWQISTRCDSGTGCVGVRPGPGATIQLGDTKHPAGQEPVINLSQDAWRALLDEVKTGALDFPG